MAKCGRCNGRVMRDGYDEDPYCLNCGWREVDVVPESILKTMAADGHARLKREPVPQERKLKTERKWTAGITQGSAWRKHRADI